MPRSKLDQNFHPLILHQNKQTLACQRRQIQEMIFRNNSLKHDMVRTPESVASVVNSFQAGPCCSCCNLTNISSGLEHQNAASWNVLKDAWETGFNMHRTTDWRILRSSGFCCHPFYLTSTETERCCCAKSSLIISPPERDFHIVVMQGNYIILSSFHSVHHGKKGNFLTKGFNSWNELSCN